MSLLSKAIYLASEIQFEVMFNRHYRRDLRLADDANYTFADCKEILKEHIGELKEEFKNKFSKQDSKLVLQAYLGHLHALKDYVAKGNEIKEAKIRREMLFYAARANQLPVIQWLIEEIGTQIYTRDSLRNNVLLIAAQSGAYDVVKWLVRDRNVDIGYHNIYERTALHYAAGGGYIDVARLLVDKARTSIEVSDRDGDTALHIAALGGHFNFVEWMIEETEVMISQSNFDGVTPLDYAVRGGNTQLAGWIVEKYHEAGKIDLYRNSTNKRKTTLLHEAVKCGKLDVVIWALTSFSLDVDHRDNDGLTPLHLAAAAGSLDIVKWLVIVYRARVDARDNNDMTPLHKAVMWRQLQTVEWLVKVAGADIMRKDRSATNAVQMAYTSSPDILEFMIEFMHSRLSQRLQIGKISRRSNLPKTSLLIQACESGDIQTVKALIHIGVDLDKTKDETSLFEKPCVEYTGYLLETLLGYKQRSYKAYNMTPLMMAAREGHVDITELLCVQGADVTKLNSCGESALLIAVKQGHEDVAKVLKAYFPIDDFVIIERDELSVDNPSADENKEEAYSNNNRWKFFSAERIASISSEESGSELTVESISSTLS